MLQDIGKETPMSARGPIVAIGGAEDKKPQCTILGEFVRLAGGAEARILVLPVASRTPLQTAGRYVDAFTGLGADEVEVLDLASRAEANDPNRVAAIDEATAVFFTGGDQFRITSLLGGTLVDDALHRRSREGLVLAGTSAGAAMMSSTMIVGGIPESTLRVGMVKLGPGLEFLRGVIIDQHFEERGRLRRLLSAVAQYPHEVGIGIDEDTAIIVDGNEARVIGSGSVTVVDAGSLVYTNLPDLDGNGNDVLALSGIQLHILPSGYGFNLKDWTAITPSAVTPNEVPPRDAIPITRARNGTRRSRTR
jgi:cyanophycinase